MKVGVYIQGERLDLYEDESISVKQVTQDLKDISKVFGDFSQTFNIPASRNNNRILKNWFNADIDNGFDARLRVSGRITINTIDFKLGKFRLDSSEVENNRPKNYKLTFFGNVIKIKDLIGEDYLKDLDWLDNFNHAYDGGVVKDGLTDGLDFTVDSVTYNDAVIYPMISYKRQWFFNSDASDDTGTDQLVNIAYASGKSNGIVSGNLKPAIRLYLIVKAIEEKYGITFNSPFFNNLLFQSIFVNLNRTTESLANGSKIVEEVSGTTSYSQPILCEYVMSVVPDAGFENVPYSIELSVNGTVHGSNTNPLTGSSTISTGDDVDYDNEYELKAEVISTENFEFSATTTFRVFYIGGFLVDEDEIFSNSFTSQVISLNTVITNEVPEIKVYDFLISLFKTFNLIATADGEDIFIDDLQSWYSDGQIYDVTKWIDLKSEKINRGKIYKDISFKFEETDQILADQFRQANNETYGELEFRLTDANGDPLTDVDGDTLEVESLFENPIYERLTDTNTNQLTQIQYCPYFDKNIKPISGNMFMFFAVQSNVGFDTLGFVNDGTYEELSTTVFTPSHTFGLNYESLSLNFNAEINEYTYSLNNRTLFSEYYKDYITDMFSIKRRIYNIEARFPDYFLNQLNLNDRLIIKNRRYIINSISSNLVKRKDTLELVNDIYDAPFKGSELNTSFVFSTYSNQTVYGFYPEFESNHIFYYVGLAGKTISLVDLGDGVGFVDDYDKTTSTDVQSIFFKLAKNNTNAYRSVGIKIEDGLKEPIFYITQKASQTGAVTMDNDFYTYDNNIITFDNG